jgi:hypothetical protein
VRSTLPSSRRCRHDAVSRQHGSPAAAKPYRRSPAADARNASDDSRSRYRRLSLARTSISASSGRPHLLFLARSIEANPTGALLPPAKSPCVVCPSLRALPRPIVMPSASSIISSSIKGRHVSSRSFGLVHGAIKE